MCQVVFKPLAYIQVRHTENKLFNNPFNRLNVGNRAAQHYNKNKKNGEVEGLILTLSRLPYHRLISTMLLGEVVAVRSSVVSGSKYNNKIKKNNNNNSLAFK